MAPLTFGCPHLAGSVFLKLHSTDIKDNLFTNKRIQLVHLDIGRLTLCVKRYLAVLTGRSRGYLCVATAAVDSVKY